MSENPESEKKLTDRLSPEQKARLQNLTTEIVHDKITISFSIDDRDPNGRKMSSFYADTIRRKDSLEGVPQGFTNEEELLVRLIVSKRVISVVYDNAVKIRMMSEGQASEEIRGIIGAYDGMIERVLTGKRA